MSSPANSTLTMRPEPLTSLTVRPATAAELSQWNSIVSRFPNYRVFHTAEWCRSLQSSSVRPVFLIVEADRQIVGALPGFIRHLGPLKIFGSPLEGSQTESMGPVFDTERVRGSDLVAAAITYLEQELNVQHIEIVSRDLDVPAMQAMGFESHTQFTFRAQLHPDHPDLGFAALNPKARNYVRKGIKLGLNVTQETDENFVSEMYAQALAVFRRRGNAISFSEDRFRRCFRALKESGTLLALAVRLPDGQCIATGLFSVDGRELVLWMWTHLFEHRNSNPTEIMTWTAMEYAAARGCTLFDMTGGGEAKKKYGGIADEKSHRWMRSRYKWMPVARHAAFKAYRWQQRLRGRIAQMRKGTPQRAAAAAAAAGSEE